MSGRLEHAAGEGDRIVRRSVGRLRGRGPCSTSVIGHGGSSFTLRSGIVLQDDTEIMPSYDGQRACPWNDRRHDT